MNRHIRSRIMENRRLKSRKDIFNLLSNKRRRRKIQKPIATINKSRYGLFEIGKCFKIKLGDDKCSKNSANASNVCNEIPSTIDAREIETIDESQLTFNIDTPAHKAPSIAQNDSLFLSDITVSVGDGRMNNMMDFEIKSSGATHLSNINCTNSAIGYFTMNQDAISTPRTPLDFYLENNSFNDSDQSYNNYSKDNTHDELSTPHKNGINRTQCSDNLNRDYSFGTMTVRDATGSSFVEPLPNTIFGDETINTTTNPSEWSYYNTPDFRTFATHLSMSERSYRNVFTNTTLYADKHQRNCPKSLDECKEFPELTAQMVLEAKSTAAKRAHEKVFGGGYEPLLEALSFL